MLLEPAVIAAAPAGPLSRWRHADGCITRFHRTRHWTDSMRLANAISVLAEAADHHPDLAISYGSITITLTTHDAGGITARDLDLAASIEPLLAS